VKQLVLSWKQKARQLKVETYTLYIACRDPRVPPHAKLFAAFLVAYAFSPIDLIPDFIPILGYLDELLLLPLGVVLALKMMPEAVIVECREKARAAMGQEKPVNRVAACVIIGIWAVIALVTIRLFILR
jgi:uncharacterized membrane protein YkvA (DUF1232 family)